MTYFCVQPFQKKKIEGVKGSLVRLGGLEDILGGGGT